MLEVRGEAPGGPSRGEWLRALARDVRHALRGLAKRPVFAIPVILTLSLGIGAASAVFSVIDAAMLRPLAYRHADRLMDVKPSGTGNSTGTLPLAALPDFLAGSRTFADGWVAYRREAIVRTDGPAAEQLWAVGVTPGADTLLGIPLLMGRSFTPDDARPGNPEVVVLSRAYFEGLGGDASILGRTVRLESGHATVVGVLRGGVRFPIYADDPHLWVPLRDDFSLLDRAADARAMDLWVRLLPGLDPESATARAEALAVGLRQEDLLAADRYVALIGIGDFLLNNGSRRALWALAATVGILLLIALVNGVNLVLVRAASRSRELAVRAAIGGSRGSVLRLLLVEGMALGVASGAAAAAVAWLAVHALRPLLPRHLTFFSPPAFPVLRHRRRAPSLGGRSADDTLAARRFRGGLVVAQVALSMTLLAAAGLFVKSFTTLMRVDPGFEHERVALAMIPLSEVRYPDPAARTDLLRRLEETLEARPEVEGVSVAGGGGFAFGTLEAEGRVAPEGGFIVPYREVGPDHLEVMGMELVAGRDFGSSDAGSPVAIVDLDLAGYLWGSESPLGRRFRIGSNGDWRTVIGVVRELQLMGRDERDGPNQILYPADPSRMGSMAQIAVRTSGDPAALLPIIQETLQGIDPEQWIWKLQTGAQALAEEEGQPRFLVTLMTLLAAVAVTLASVGLYGVLAYSVARRNRELGIRVALGADRRRVRRMVLSEGLGVAAGGIALGVAGAALATRTLEQLLYEVEPGDPSTLLGTAALFLLIAAAASLLPAARATRADPVEVLRAE
jgi:putative ABC transport system permease protein